MYHPQYHQVKRKLGSERLVCGVDEAGRGPLAGPVVAAAVVLPDSAFEGLDTGTINDSKQMSPQQRRISARIIRDRCIDSGIGWCWPEEIDRLNIHRATLLAMKRALAMLNCRPDIVLVDGLFVPNVRLSCVPVVRGDEKVQQIQAASILAKTIRDLWMQRYGRIDTEFGFERHKGYATREHRILLGRLPPSPIHRRSFNLSFCVEEQSAGFADSERPSGSL
jgi:ribonuclease HII